MSKLTLHLRNDYDYSSSQAVWSVMSDGIVVGLLEKWRGKPRWLAYTRRGSWLGCRRLGGYKTRAAAMRAIRKAAGL